MKCLSYSNQEYTFKHGYENARTASSTGATF